MKKIILAIIIFLLIPALTSAFQKEAKITIKIATLAPRGETSMFERFKDRVLAETNNEVYFKTYYGGIQGDESDVLRKIRFGQLHGGGFTGHGLGKIVPEVRVTELPYLFKNYGEVTYIRSKLEDTMNRLFREKGYEVIAWGEVGFVYNFSKIPITSIEVARSQKWWMWEGDRLGQAMFDALDIAPVPLPLTDVLTSLSTRMIDTASSTPFGAVAFRWYTRFKYMDEYPSMNAIGALIVTKKKWDRISPESRRKIKEIMGDHYKNVVKLERDQNDRSIEILKKAGITIVHADKSDETRKFILDAAKKARESLIGVLYSREFLESTLTLLEEYRAKNPSSEVMRIK
ncbi:MAG: TRAP transporter substrate-binding protein DctP [Deltaproteobacteria bacterium]|nr:TRAP transporter substrate-binding protein DctP [Deltaproteobacteria bacterium]